MRNIDQRLQLQDIIPKDWKRELLPGGRGILIRANSYTEANLCVMGTRPLLEQCANELGRIVLVWGDDQTEEDGIVILNPVVERIQRQMKLMYRREEDFINQMIAEGKVVCITSNVTRDRAGFPTNTDHPLMGRDICYSNRIPLERGLVQPYKRIGKSYRAFWRDGGNNIERLNPDYYKMKASLDKHGIYAEPHRGYRVAQQRDGVWVADYCEYHTTFTLACFWGDIVRIAISEPDGWEILHSEELTDSTVRALSLAGTTSIIDP